MGLISNFFLSFCSPRQKSVLDSQVHFGGGCGGHNYVKFYEFRQLDFKKKD